MQHSLSSGYPFPLPIHLILANVYILLRLAAVVLLLSPRFREIVAVRKAARIPGPPPSIQTYVSQGTHYLVPDLPELSLPLAPIPSNVTTCGPIVPLSTINKDANQPGKQFLEWMNGGKTVLVNFGSHVAPGRSYCESLARGLEVALRKHKDLRVLWKLKRDQGASLDESLTCALGDAWNEDRVKIVEWLEVAPAHLLMLEGVVVSVHHGGANAYFETARSVLFICRSVYCIVLFWFVLRPFYLLRTRAGVPQIILPVWYDTYGNATCAEYLKIGVYANKTCAPGVSDTEFGEALCMLLDETNARGREIRATAQALGERCRKVEGREVAADVIVRIARGEM